MNYTTKIPVNERIYCPEFREVLQPLEGFVVEVSGRIKEFREHPSKKYLQTILLVNLIVTPVPLGESFPLTHLWFLTKHLKKLKLNLSQNERIRFTGIVYSYCRKGGKSESRGILNSHDFSILPMST